ncbi:SAM-dependent methyltransferase [Methylocapsa sp. D3K7]|uniref:class I SAM-dependent methyltransferase n=1 Tax=Methylocapsa sp. D3K7 TaxID=3041435 RepID=UPI00244E70E0|nr:SAM-dependent methyltransferase [Methylocapsa sp. D3K7]WGJ15946.1 SAM-dependent methyltransferase [Methylocapsa sp. D3K7]
MAAIENVTGTAFVVAEFRAEEAAEAKPLYEDKIVPVFLNEDTKRAAARIAETIPAVKKMVRIRTRYLDDRLDAQLRDGCKQVVILGAGLDTRAIRKQAPDVVYFEIDDETTLSFKKATLAENRLTADVSFIYGNYVTDDFIRLLISNGFDGSRPAHFIWEGNTMYLTADSIRQVMADIVRHVPQFTLSFDYFKEDVINEATGDAAATLITERFAAMGAPWRTGIGDIQRLADEAAMRLVDNVATAELHRAYWPGKALETAIFDYYFLCTLQSPAR